MPASASGSWSLRIGRWRGIEIRVHIYVPLAALVVLLVASLPDYAPLDVAARLPPSAVPTALAALGVLLARGPLPEIVPAGGAPRGRAVVRSGRRSAR
ncbi:MAG TPA: hypothetical protein PKC18_14080, partial [Lacipirellulaceae bacterium]|nr:hypothetical protein [Lacipirellulaceae bacterium]